MKMIKTRRARAFYQRTRFSSHKQNYNHLANSLKKILIKHKTSVFQNHLTNFITKDGSLWRATKQLLKYKTPKLPIRKFDESFATSDSEKAKLFKLHLYETFDHIRTL